MHTWALVASVPAGILLLAASEPGVARAATAVYVASLLAVFGASAAYHRLRLSTRARRRMRQLDHSMIYVLIAGSYTPIALLALRPAWSVTMVSIAWAGALVGILLTVTGLDRLQRVGLVLYLTLGWLPIVAAHELVRGLTDPQLALLLAGGVAYTAGAAMLAAKRPRLRPATFGYHEFWHAMVVGGGACHYVLILLLVRA
jgi:hemolysin III